MSSPSPSLYAASPSPPRPCVVPFKFRRKSLNASDVDPDEARSFLYPALAPSPPCAYASSPPLSAYGTSAYRTSNDYSSASSSPIASSLALGSVPSSPTGRPHIRYESSPIHDPSHYAIRNPFPGEEFRRYGSSDESLGLDNYHLRIGAKPSASLAVTGYYRRAYSYAYSSPSEVSEDPPLTSDFEMGAVDNGECSNLYLTCLGVGWLGPTKGWSDLAIGLASIRRDLSLLSHVDVIPPTRRVPSAVCGRSAEACAAAGACNHASMGPLLPGLSRISRLIQHACPMAHVCSASRPVQCFTCTHRVIRLAPTLTCSYYRAAYRTSEHLQCFVLGRPAARVVREMEQRCCSATKSGHRRAFRSVGVMIRFVLAVSAVECPLASLDRSELPTVCASFA